MLNTCIHASESAFPGLLHDAGGTVTTILTPDEASQMEAIAQELNITVTEMKEEDLSPLPEADGTDLDKAKQGLEDLFNLM